MPRLPHSTAMCVAMLTVSLAGCSSDEKSAPDLSTPKAESGVQLPPLSPENSPPPGPYGISADGVTTRVDAPAEATESEYGQACHAAKMWMDDRGGDPHALIEHYLTILQNSAFTGPGNFNTPWAQLAPGQQAGVIMAVIAAADEQCG